MGMKPQKSTGGNKEMKDELSDHYETLKKIPTIGFALLNLFIIGAFAIVILASPFKEIDWIYSRAIFPVEYAYDALPMYIAWWGIISIGILFIEGMDGIRKIFRNYIKDVAHEEEIAE